MIEKKQSKEPQYQVQIETLAKLGPVQMGPTASHSWRSDPRRLLFFLSRYKFCAKMLAGKKNALEVGCGDGFGMRLVLQTVPHVHGIDFDPIFVEWAAEHARKEGLSCDFSLLDITRKLPPGIYDSAYSLDLIEHIEPSQEHLFWSNIYGVLEADAVFIVGTPNKSSSAYASLWSQKGHINLQTHDQLYSSMVRYFKNVIMFSMNDEIVHTGFYPMAHYLLCMGVGVKKYKE